MNIWGATTWQSHQAGKFAQRLWSWTPAGSLQYPGSIVQGQGDGFCPSPSSSSLPTSGWGRFLPIWFTLWGSLSQEYSWVVLTIPTPPSHICRIFASTGAGPGDRARSKAGLGCLSEQLLLKGLVPKMDFPPLKLPVPFFAFTVLSGADRKLVSGAGVTALVLQCLLACTTPLACCLALTKPGTVLCACDLSAGEVEKFKVSFSCKASVKAGWTT